MNLRERTSRIAPEMVTDWSSRIGTRSGPKFGKICNCEISDVQWSWSLDGKIKHEIATGIFLSEVDISNWVDKDAVRKELLRLEHLRFHIRMGNQTQQRTWEKTLAVQDHPYVPFVPRPDFHFPPLRYDFRRCRIMKGVRASVCSKIGYGKSIDTQESEEDLQREIDFFHDLVVEDNRVALGFLDRSVVSYLRIRFEERWGISKDDKNKFALIISQGKHVQGI